MKISYAGRLNIILGAGLLLAGLAQVSPQFESSWIAGAVVLSGLAAANYLHHACRGTTTRAAPMEVANVRDVVRYDLIPDSVKERRRLDLLVVPHHGRTPYEYKVSKPFVREDWMYALHARSGRVERYIERNELPALVEAYRAMVVAEKEMAELELQRAAWSLLRAHAMAERQEMPLPKAQDDLPKPVYLH
jgi:hypothetical protein